MATTGRHPWVSRKFVGFALTVVALGIGGWLIPTGSFTAYSVAVVGAYGVFAGGNVVDSHLEGAKKLALGKTTP